MKKTLLSFVNVILVAASLCAAPVDPSLARKTANAFLRSLGADKAARQITDITAQTPFSQLYIFSIGDGNGFVVIAGDDNSEPVLAYSLTSPFPADDIPDHVKAWLLGYQQQVAANGNAPQSQAVRQHWNDVLSARPVSQTKELISQMLQTKWDQSPYYNDKCPYDNPNAKPPCGCTATATAQIMKYFNHPQTGYGYESYTHRRYGFLEADYGATTYQWDSMPEKLTIYSNQNEIDAVATLIYHIGVAVHMDYQISGSAGKTASYGYGGEPSSENAFKYNFAYSPYVWTAFRIDYTIDEWKELMLTELRAGRPILYAGYDELQYGHAFVIDGYNSANDRFHFNWGWGGKFDGYFSLDNLNPGTANNRYNFNLFATATIGIEPYPLFNPSSTTTVATAIEALQGVNAADCSVTGAGSYQFGDTITMTATSVNENVRFAEWSDGCRYNPRSTVATGGELSFTARFAPVAADTLRYHTCDNAMNRASNLPDGIGRDSVWGVKIPAASLRSHYDLTAVRFMGRRAATHTLSLYAGTDSPTELLYTATFFDSLDYPYSWYQHDLPQPLVIDNSKSLWVKLHCSEVDTAGVFSIYGGNPNGMLVGDDLAPRTDWLFSWMIEPIFASDGTIGINDVSNAAPSINPNPASGTVTVGGLGRAAAVEVFDIEGRLCLSFSAVPGTNTVDVSALRPGCYIVRVTSETTATSQKLIIR